MLQTINANEPETAINRLAASGSLKPAPPAMAYYLRGGAVTSLTAEAADTKAADLPATLVIAPGVYRFHGEVFTAREEGLYRFFAVPKDTQQRIVFQNDRWALCSALAWMHSHGYREDRENFEELTRRALIGKLIMTCGPYSAFSRQLMTRLGIPCRPVNTSAVDRNGYDDGHVLFEVEMDGRWTLVDIDQHIIFQQNGRRLSLLELLPLIAPDKYDLERLALSIPLAIGNFKDTEGGYDYGPWMETAIHDEATLRKWYRRIMRMGGIENQYTPASEADRPKIERERKGIRMLSHQEFKKRFYRD